MFNLTGWIGKRVKVFATNNEGAPIFSQVIAIGTVREADEFHSLYIEPEEEWKHSPAVYPYLYDGLLPAETSGVEEIPTELESLQN